MKATRRLRRDLELLLLGLLIGALSPANGEFRLLFCIRRRSAKYVLFFFFFALDDTSVSKNS